MRMVNFMTNNDYELSSMYNNGEISSEEYLMRLSYESRYNLLNEISNNVNEVLRYEIEISNVDIQRLLSFE